MRSNVAAVSALAAGRSIFPKISMLSCYARVFMRKMYMKSCYGNLFGNVMGNHVMEGSC